MDADRVNRWLTLGANVGVLIGLYLLIVEINQNSELMRVQIEQDRSESFVAWQRQLALDETASRIFLKASSLDGSRIEIYDQLEPLEQQTIRMIENARYFDYENLYSQYQQGFVSQAYWEERIVPVIQGVAPFWKALWPPDGPVGRRAFKEEIERILQLPNQYQDIRPRMREN